MFSGDVDALQEILYAGYTTVSIAQSLQNYSPTLFTHCIIIYGGTFDEELADTCITYYKQNNLYFDVCREMSNNKYYNASTKVLANLFP